MRVASWEYASVVIARSQQSPSLLLGFRNVLVLQTSAELGYTGCKRRASKDDDDASMDASKDASKGCMRAVR